MNANRRESTLETEPVLTCRDWRPFASRRVGIRGSLLLSLPCFRQGRTSKVQGRFCSSSLLRSAVYSLPFSVLSVASCETDSLLRRSAASVVPTCRDGVRCPSSQLLTPQVSSLQPPFPPYHIFPSLSMENLSRHSAVADPLTKRAWVPHGDSVIPHDTSMVAAVFR